MHYIFSHRGVFTEGTGSIRIREGGISPLPINGYDLSMGYDNECKVNKTLFGVFRGLKKGDLGGQNKCELGMASP
jgi:hypothetical protein